MGGTGEGEELRAVRLLMHDELYDVGRIMIPYGPYLETSQGMADYLTNWIK